MAEDKSKMVDLDTSGEEVEIVLDEQESKNKEELTNKMNKICDTLEYINDINKQNTLYQLYDDKLIDIDRINTDD